MKTIIFNFTAIALLTLCTTIRAQPGGPPDKGMKKIESLKMEFISKKLDLSPPVAQRFWPVYNVYQKELNMIFRERHIAKKAQRDGGPPFDDLKFETRILELKKKYKKDFEAVLPDEKVTDLYTAEREFREQLMIQLRKRHEQDKDRR